MPESIIEIVDRLKRYYPISLIEWVYEFDSSKLPRQDENTLGVF